MKDVLSQMTEDELRKAMDEWNREQDHANNNLPDSVLPMPRRLERRPPFCRPTFVVMSAQALEDKEK